MALEAYANPASKHIPTRRSLVDAQDVGFSAFSSGMEGRASIRESEISTQVDARLVCARALETRDIWNRCKHLHRLEPLPYHPSALTMTRLTERQRA